MIQLYFDFVTDGYPSLYTRMQRLGLPDLVFTTPYGRKHFGNYIKENNPPDEVIYVDKAGARYAIGTDSGGQTCFIPNGIEPSCPAIRYGDVAKRDQAIA
jgi:hypothetical protein